MRNSLKNNTKSAIQYRSKCSKQTSSTCNLLFDFVSEITIIAPTLLLLALSAEQGIVLMSELLLVMVK